MPHAIDDLPTKHSPSLWAELESFLARMAAQAMELRATDQFLSDMLLGAARLMGSWAAIAWIRKEPGGFVLAAEHSTRGAGFARSPAWQVFHQRVLSGLGDRRQAQFFEPVSRSDPPADFSNWNDDPAQNLVLVTPIRMDGALFGAIEFVLPPASCHAARQGYARFAAALAAIAADQLRSGLLRDLRQEMSRHQTRDNFVRRLHASLDSQYVAYVVANEGRIMAGWDRLAVVLVRGTSPRLTAVSGAETVDRRAHGNQLLEQLVGAVLLADEPLFYKGSPGELPPELDALLQNYVDQTHTRSIAILPMHRPSLPPGDDDRIASATDGQVIGALVAENYGECAAENGTRLLEWISAVATTALANAMDYEQVPYAHAWRRWRARLPQTRKQCLSYVMLIAVVVCASLLLIPANLYVTATGELWPVERRHIYAAVDGVVERVEVEHGEKVADGQRLAILRNPTLEAEIESLVMKLRATEAERDAISTSLIERRTAGDDVRTEEHLLSARKHALNKEVEGLQEQLNILRQQHERLQLHSPISGQVITWDTRQRLLDRPVRHGDALLMVADLESPWVVELQVPNRQIGHIVSADEHLDSIPLRFVLELDSRRVYAGTVTELAVAAEHDNEHGSTVRVTASVDRNELAHYVPGAEVRAKIFCGQRCLGFVWFHGLIDALRTKLLL